MPHFLKQNIFEIQQCNLVSALSGSFVEEERGALLALFSYSAIVQLIFNVNRLLD